MPPTSRLPNGALAAPLPILEGDRPVTALILDDSEFDRRRIARLLEKASPGIQVLEAETMAEFEAALEEGPMDLVFIDYLLVGTDGLSALDELLSRPDQQGATAIMLASQGNLRVAMSAMRRGCADYIEKSELSAEGLAETLSRALGRRLLQAALETPGGLEATLQGTALRLVAATSVELRAKAEELIERLKALCTKAGPGPIEAADESEALAAAAELMQLLTELQGHAARGLRGPVGRMI